MFSSQNMAYELKFLIKIPNYCVPWPTKSFKPVRFCVCDSIKNDKTATAEKYTRAVGRNIWDNRRRIDGRTCVNFAGERRDIIARWTAQCVWLAWRMIENWISESAATTASAWDRRRLSLLYGVRWVVQWPSSTSLGIGARIPSSLFSPNFHIFLKLFT